MGGGSGIGGRFYGECEGVCGGDFGVAGGVEDEIGRNPAMP